MRTPLAAALCSAALLACSDGPRIGPVTVTVTAGAPVAGAPVLFHRPDGSVHALAATDEHGQATAVVADGALVTVGVMSAGTTDRWVLTTITGVTPGDELVLADAPGVATTGAADVTFSSAVQGASSYRVDAACTSAFADDGYVESLSMTLAGCGASLDAVAIARAPGGALLAYATAVDAPITGTAPAQAASVALGAWRTDFGTLAVEVTNAPAGSQFLVASLVPRRGGRLFSTSTSGDGSALAAGESAALALTYPKDFATSARLEALVQYGSSGVVDGGAAVVLPATALGDLVALDLTTSLPPRLSGAALTETDGKLVASWQQAAPDAGLDATVLTTWWAAENGDHAWRIVVPPGKTSLTLPALPPALSDYAPKAAAAPAELQVVAYDDADTRGYGAFKATRLGLLSELPSNADLALRRTSTWTAGP